MKKPAHYFFSLLLCLMICGHEAAYSQSWQWSVPVEGGISKKGPSRAFLWIPPECKKLRGLVLAQNNMEELSIIENKSFRDSMSTIGFGIVWVSPAFDILFNVPNGAGKVFTRFIADLAERSGYRELNFVPMVPMGHSASANFPYSFSAWFPERTLCGISVSGMYPYDFENIFGLDTWEGRTVDNIPSLMTVGEYEGASSPNANFNKIFNRMEAHPHTAVTVLPCAGEYHFATSQKKTDFIAYYIKTAAHYRLIKDATEKSLATLKPIDPVNTGWLIDRWEKDKMPRYPSNTVAAYTGIRKESFWCFDQEMAKRIEEYQGAYYKKIPCLLAYNQNGMQVPQTNNHVQVTLKFIPLNDSLDFELSSSFLDTVPAVSGRLRGWAGQPVGAKIGRPSNPELAVIDKTIGPFVKLGYSKATGITTFRMMLEPGLGTVPTNYKHTAIFSVAHPGDERYKPSVLQADMDIPVVNNGKNIQTINFPKIPDIKPNVKEITLNAISDMGLPVQYYVLEGPAVLQGNRLKLTKVPPKARYPVKVTVVAWQWGRNEELAARTAGTDLPLAGQSVKTALPVEQTFYIYK
ncbi:hypothetical protein HDC92_003958 [Pedobacter sp. AK017]|uniref:hypothetical protein n=1 Tax=Pedobacter sp. AK017 TaxID=2723073 RepID=UPI0016099A95|nr:hypothetical protein [Pedobacter sp. AK017]MBB5440258.1 hypothetical protein [Pedobacter sp. AK017]